YVRYIVQRRRVSRLCERCRKSFDESCEPSGAVNDTFATKGRSLDHPAPNSLGEADATVGRPCVSSRASAHNGPIRLRGHDSTRLRALLSTSHRLTWRRPSSPRCLRPHRTARSGRSRCCGATSIHVCCGSCAGSTLPSPKTSRQTPGWWPLAISRPFAVTSE